MEHAKKMTLVDSNFAVDPRNIKRHYSSLDQSVVDILNRQDIDDYEKLILYRIALNKFLVNKKNLEADLDEPLKVQLNTPKTEEEPTPTTNQSVERRQEFKNETPASLPTHLSDTGAEAVETIPPKISSTTRSKKKKVANKKRSISSTTFPSPPLSRKRKRTRTQWISL